MKIKNFKARNFSEALAMVKKEMGEEAVILSSEEQKGFRPCVKVTAAVDYELEEYSRASRNFPPEAVEKRGTEGREKCAPESFPGSVETEERKAGRNASEFAEIRKDLELIMESLQDIRMKGSEASLPESRRRIVQYLRQRSIREDLALKLSEKAGTVKELAGSLALEIPTCPEEGGKKIILVIGPTGVGKTTTIAKLSARAIKAGKRAAIINLDTYRIGAIEQIRIYARIMGIPLDIASDIEELKSGLLKYSDRDMVFIDTSGRNPKSDAYIEELKLIYTLGIPVETHLLMSANSDEDFMAESFRHYGKLNIDRIAFTKVDEAVRFGSIYNVANLCRKPIAYITNGQRVPQDIEFPDGNRLAVMILRNGAA